MPDEKDFFKKHQPKSAYGCLLWALLAVFGGMFLLITTFFTIEFFKDSDYMLLVASGCFAIPPAIVLIIMAAMKKRGKANLEAFNRGDYAVYVCPYERKMWSSFKSASRRGGGVWYSYYIEIGGMTVAINLDGSEYERLPVPGEIKVVILNIGMEKKFFLIQNSVQ